MMPAWPNHLETMMISSAAEEAEHGPEGREVLSRRVGLVIVHKEDVRRGEQDQHRDADQRNGLQPVSQELDEFGQAHIREQRGRSS